MTGVVRRKRKTLFGKLVRKIESELTQKDERMISYDLPPNDCEKNSDDSIEIELRRKELKSDIKSNSDIIKFCDL